MSGRETALTALWDAIREAIQSAIPAATVLDRNQGIAEPEVVSVSDAAAILVGFEDGEAAEPTALMGNAPTWDHVQTAMVQILAIHPDAAQRNPALDAALDAIAAALTANPTLSGCAAFTQPHPPIFSNLGDADAPFGKAAELPIDLLFTTTSPIG